MVRSWVACSVHRQCKSTRRDDGQKQKSDQDVFQNLHFKRLRYERYQNTISFLWLHFDANQKQLLRYATVGPIALKRTLFA